MLKLLFLTILVSFYSCSNEEEPIQPNDGSTINPNEPASPAEQPPTEAAAQPDGSATPVPPTDPTYTETDTATSPSDGTLTEDPYGAPAPIKSDKAEPAPPSEYSKDFDDSGKVGKKAAKKGKGCTRLKFDLTTAGTDAYVNINGTTVWSSETTTTDAVIDLSSYTSDVTVTLGADGSNGNVYFDSLELEP